MSVRSTLYFDHKVWAFQTNQVVVALLVGSTYWVDVFKLFYYYYSLTGALLQNPSTSPEAISRSSSLESWVGWKYERQSIQRSY
ncbi:uncharacterized protein BO66DRAFT_390719 [Aspergillus aculeatinus CBS 121060]|uniref:Uncharacterized protein n=1 Tax=Aspergillus aculeatinus CBS 121060 TaxID=1448322 RepID=A0ACD1HD34_9EURO|nr:hypothetical protein BO66DRAFT_390719 [Aspergillus aculeatinus CBS 121060]RAH71493.1 hypothetical protein BO66DRAFT_390719 [Aspergillus aculeatinus CBS 121060]